jgi:hypothetical protein
MTDEAPGQPGPDDPGRRLEELLAEHRDEPDTPAEDRPDPYDPFAPATAEETAPEAAEAAEGGEPGDPEEPEDSLPEAPLFALLRTVEAEIGIDRIDRVWVFPARRLERGETSLAVVAAFPDIDADRRRVYAAHYTAHDEADEARLVLDEFGTAPTDRVGRLVEDVVERIKDGPAEAPRSHTIRGEDERWHAFLHELAETFLEDARKSRRLR